MGRKAKEQPHFFHFYLPGVSDKCLVITAFPLFHLPVSFFLSFCFLPVSLSLSYVFDEEGSYKNTIPELRLDVTQIANPL